jgi:NAD(P)H-hydrate epimerase
MAGAAALRAGAGLVTVASAADRLAMLELMTERLPSTWTELQHASARQNVIALGPGLGTERGAMARDAVALAPQAVVVDADGLNSLAGHPWKAAGVRVLTPHPGEMSRLCGETTAKVQADRLGIARRFAQEHNCILVLKGHRSVIAMPDGRSWINPTGSPAMATGGTGDILTGLIAGLLAQFPGDPKAAVIAGVYLHGLAGELGAAELGEPGLVATDLLAYLPEAISDCQNVPDEL